jgi:opacity protein-like surface antigen
MFWSEYCVYYNVKTNLKSMKKILLSLGAAFLLAAGAQAQTSWGLKAGLNFPKITVSGNGESESSGTSTNFHVTGYASIPAATNFAIQPGLSLQGKGGKADVLGEDVTTNLMYLEVPVNAVYYIPTGYTGSVFVGAGPYAGLGLSGKVKGGDESMDIEFGSNADEMKRFDWGFNFLLGYKLNNGFLINGGYGLGLGNLSNVDGITSNNRVFSVGIGYEF